MIKVGVVGALGKMGQEVVSAVLADSELELVCAVDKFAAGQKVGNIEVIDDMKKFEISQNPIFWLILLSPQQYLTL